MIRGSLLLAAALAALPPAAAPAMQSGAKPAANPFSARLQALPDLQRRSVLRRAILDSGQYCRRVDAAAPGGRFKNLAMWTARCDRGGAYGVFIGPDASVQVRPCNQLAQLKLPACARLAPPAAAPR